MLLLLKISSISFFNSPFVFSEAAVSPKSALAILWVGEAGQAAAVTEVTVNAKATLRLDFNSLFVFIIVLLIYKQFNKN